MAKKTTRIKTNANRRYVGIFIDNDTYDVLLDKAKLENETFSDIVRIFLNKAVSNGV